jgi:hypothetical protein
MKTYYSTLYPYQFTRHSFLPQHGSNFAFLHNIWRKEKRSESARVIEHAH